MVYDIIGMYEENSLEQILYSLEDKYPEKEIREAYREIEELKEAGQLFSEDIYEKYIDGFKNRQTVVKALCLHIAHDWQSLHANIVLQRKESTTEEMCDDEF